MLRGLSMWCRLLRRPSVGGCSNGALLCLARSSLAQLRRAVAGASSDPQTELRKQVLTVRPYFGTLRIKGNIKYVILPDIEHQCGSVCVVRLLATAGHAPPHLEVLQSEDRSELSITGHCEVGASTCEVTLPIKYDLTATLTGSGGVEVSGLQNDSTNISTEVGDTALGGMQALLVRYRTHTGRLVLGGKLLASLDAEGDRMSISGTALQSGSVRIKARELTWELQSVHAHTVHVEADQATVVVKDMTASSHLRIGRADVTMDNCSGALSWEFEEATVEVGIPQLVEDSCIEVDRGTCSVACPAEYRYGIAVTGQEVKVRPGFSDLKEDTAGALQSVRAEVAGPQLRVLLKQGVLSLVPWCWPVTQH